MTLAPGARAASLRGFSLALMMFLSSCSCDQADLTIKGTDGEAASLPCECPPDSPPFLVWQKVTDEQPLVVNYYRDDHQDDAVMASEFRNRTELKLRGNCSLVFHSLSLSDQGLYECYYKTSPLSKKLIHLLVTEKHRQLSGGNGRGAMATALVCTFLLVSAALVGIVCGKRRRMRRSLSSRSRSGV